MQWEYLRVDHFSPSASGPSYSASPADELTEAVLARDTMLIVGFGIDRNYGQLNDLGVLGWELIAMSPGHPDDDLLWRWVFKRPVARS